LPPKERDRWLELLSYIVALVYHERSPVEHPRLQAEIEASVRTDEQRREVSTMGKSMADVLMDKGRKEGRKEGRKKGREEGQREGATRARQQTLLRSLGQRFGDLPSTTVAAVTATDSIEQLDAWLDRVFTATSLAEVGIPAT